MRTLLLGETLVVLRSPQPAPSLAAAEAFVPRLGGAVAAIAVRAAQSGADVAAASVVGDDAWGRWIAERLAAAGVDTSAIVFAEGEPTPLVFTSPSGRIAFHGRPLAQRLDPPPVDGGALLLTAGTLASEDERDRTLAARDAAIADDRPVLVDLSFDPHRFETPAFAASEARALVKGAFAVVAGPEEARLVSGEDEPPAAPDGLVAMGARHAIVTGAASGASLRGGGLRLDARGTAPAAPHAVLGAMLAELAATDFYPPAIAVALPRAVQGG